MHIVTAQFVRNQSQYSMTASHKNTNLHFFVPHVFSRMRWPRKCCVLYV